MEQKKCLLIDQYSSIGGGQTIFLNLIQACLQAGIFVTALFPHGGELERKVKNEFGEKVVTVHLRESNLTRGRKNLLDILKSALFTLSFLKFLRLLKQHDYIYTNGPRIFPAVLFASYFVKRRYIYHLHLEHSKKEKRLIVAIAKRPTTHRVIANSNFLYKQLCEFDQSIRDNPKVIVIENSLTPALSCLPFVDRFSKSEDFHVATFGRISYEKGQDLIVDAALQLPDWNFFLVGDADFAFERELRRRSPTNVKFVPKVDEPAKLIDESNIKICVMPSRVDESFGLAAIESMAASCIAILSGQGELPNIARRTSALIFDSPHNLAANLERLQKTPAAELTELARGQFSKTKSEYSFDIFAQKIKELFRK